MTAELRSLGMTAELRSLGMTAGLRSLGMTAPVIPSAVGERPEAITPR